MIERINKITLIMRNFLKYPAIIFFLSLSFASFSQSERKDFLVEIIFIDWLNQPFVKYSLTQNNIKVETSIYSDFRKTKTLYNRKLSKSASYSIYSSLLSFNIDTSKANCDNPVLDGLYIDYHFEGDGVKSTTIKTHSCFTKDARTLFRLVEGQILKKKFTYSGLKD